jgi:virulence-associated protein VapD
MSLSVYLKYLKLRDLALLHTAVESFQEIHTLLQCKRRIPKLYEMSHYYEFYSIVPFPRTTHDEKRCVNSSSLFFG